MGFNLAFRSVTGGCILSVLDRGKEGQEGKCASGTEWVEMGAKERGEVKEEEGE